MKKYSILRKGGSLGNRKKHQKDQAAFRRPCGWQTRTDHFSDGACIAVYHENT